MSDMTINFGIDLGTTNSCIARLENNKPEIIENIENNKYTPSAVAIDKKGKMYVGSKAVTSIVRGDKGAYREFKLQMGTSHEYYFPAINSSLKPEELSAEVLKSLRADVKNRLNKEVTNTVISVPAAFETIQTHATLKAAELAGFSHTMLVQEPVAAAIAYGLDNQDDRTVWLIYDFGGGTFDAAIVQIIDGQFKIVNHGGDNHLGGKSIDWEIVDKLLVPALVKEYKLSDFNRGNEKWKVAFAKLKQKAEEAKIELSRDDTAEIFIDNLGQDEEGQWMSFEHEIERDDLKPLIEPLVEKSVNICRKAINDSGITIEDIDKLIMVGGSTLSPILRDMVYGKLDITLEFSIDPLTVVARGAAVFAGAQPAVAPPKEPEANEYAIDLDFKPMSSESDPIIGGKVRASNDESLNGLQIEFMESKSEWRSPKIGLNDEGEFITMVHAEPGRTNEFQIILTDDKGNTLTTVPNSFPYTIGGVPDQTLIHSVGVANANKTTDIFIKRGTSLPAKFHKVYKTAFAINKGESRELFKIPVVEGENTSNADRNIRIGELFVPGDKIKIDLPAGSEIEVTLEIDESRDITIRAYVPILDEVYEDVLRFENKVIRSALELKTEFNEEKERLNKARIQAAGVNDINVNERINEINERLDKEKLMHEIEESLKAASADPDAADNCQKRLIEFQEAIDEIDDNAHIPLLIKDLQTTINHLRGVIESFGDDGDKATFLTIDREINEDIIPSKDPHLIKEKMEELRTFGFIILSKRPEFWMEMFIEMDKMIKTSPPQGMDIQQAMQFLEMGHMAINNGDLEQLKNVVVQLQYLVPVEVSDNIISILTEG